MTLVMREVTSECYCHLYPQRLHGIIVRSRTEKKKELTLCLPDLPPLCLEFAYSPHVSPGFSLGGFWLPI